MLVKLCYLWYVYLTKCLGDLLKKENILLKMSEYKKWIENEYKTRNCAQKYSQRTLESQENQCSIPH